MKKRYVILKLQDNLEIIVIGDYVPSSKEVNYQDGDGVPAMPGSFNITKIDIVTGTLLDYTDFIENLVRKYPNLSIQDHFEELAILQIEKDV